MWGDLVLALPVIMWQMWRFIVPALHAKEKKYAIPFIVSSVALFALGGFVAYWTLEKALEFLIAWAGADVEANFQVSKYISLVGLMVARVRASPSSSPCCWCSCSWSACSRRRR